MDLKTLVNLGLFCLMLIVWIALGILKLTLHLGLPDDLNALFFTLGGGWVTMLYAFEKGVTFGSTVESSSTSTTTTASVPPLAGDDDPKKP